MSKLLRYENYLKYYNRKYDNKQDNAELFSILWVRDHMDDNNMKTYEFKYDEKTTIEINHNDYIMLCGYLIWLSYRNNNENEEEVNYFYFKKFREICMEFSQIEQKLIEKLFIEQYYNEEYNEFYKEFFETSEDLITKDHAINKDNLYDQLKKIGLEEKIYIKTMRMVLEIFNRKIYGKLGNQNKKCIITDKFKKPEKYKLEIGQEFISQKELAQYCNKRVETITLWRKKGWII
jgi:hypothetical protein